MTRRQRLALVVDWCLTRCDRLWVGAAGGRRRRREARRLDPMSGRTSPEHLLTTTTPDIWAGLVGALDNGADVTELAIHVAAVTDEAAARVVSNLERRAAQMHREHRAIRRGMHRRMRVCWGPALDLFYEIFVCTEELGSDLQQIHRDSRDAHSQALLGLHARCCLVLCEIHTLLERGFPLGAWARARSLHETAVIATVLSTFGREPGLDDLSERFLLHATIDQMRDAELADKSGATVDPDDLDALRRERKDLQDRFGSMYGKDFGWARPLFPGLRDKARVTFDELERLADTGLQRLSYRLGSHHVHATAWTLQLNQLTRAGDTFLLTGPTNINLGGPATVALTSMLVASTALVWGLTDEIPEPIFLVGLGVIRNLADRAVPLFDAGQALVDRREGRIQARRERAEARRAASAPDERARRPSRY